MNYSAIKYFDIANGEGVRTSLFVSGCRRHCPYCFNGEAWRFDAGEPFDEAVQAKVIESLGAAFCDGLTILGGEPMEPENQEGLVEFVERVKREVPNKAIWCFTGDTLDELEPGGPHFTEFTNRLPRLRRRVGRRAFRKRLARHYAALPRLVQPARHRYERNARSGSRGWREAVAGSGVVAGRRSLRHAFHEARRCA